MALYSRLRVVFGLCFPQCRSCTPLPNTGPAFIWMFWSACLAILYNNAFVFVLDCHVLLALDAQFQFAVVLLPTQGFEAGLQIVCSYVTHIKQFLLCDAFLGEKRWSEFLQFSLRGQLVLRGWGVLLALCGQGPSPTRVEDSVIASQDPRSQWVPAFPSPPNLPYQPLRWSYRYFILSIWQYSSWL